MNRYTEMVIKQQEELSHFPIEYAFDEKQLEEALVKLGLRRNQKCRVCSVFGCGDIVKKEDVPKLLEMMKRHREEFSSAVSEDKTGDGFIYEMFDAEFSNHEYSYTRDPSDALAALGLNMKMVNSDPVLKHGFEKASKHQLEFDAFDLQ